MSITTQKVKDRCIALTDSDGTGYWNDASDYLPAINHAQEWVVNLINAARSTRKVSDEVFRELRFAKVYQTSQHSRIYIDNNFWFIDAVFPLPNTDPAPNIAANADPDESVDRSAALRHVSSAYSADRLTIEEWAENIENPFKAGNILQDISSATEGSSLCLNFAYLDAIDYGATGTNAQNTFIEIRPYLDERLCTIVFVQEPSEVTTFTATSLPFDRKMLGMIAAKMAQFLSAQERDDISLYQVTQQEINAFLSIFG